MATVNLYPTEQAIHKTILDKFPAAWQPKLLAYTTEELFYFYKLCCLKVQHNRIWVDGEWQQVGVKDMFFLGLRAKFYRSMKEDKIRPMTGDIWIKLHHRFRHKYETFMSQFEMEKERANNVRTIELLSFKFNNKRYA